MEIVIHPDPRTSSHAAARVIARLVSEKPDAVLGLATGSTPLVLYNELVRMHEREGLDFSRITTFNLDEYVGLDRSDPQSYGAFMWENLFGRVNLQSENVHIPDGMTDDVPAFCARYEKAILDAGGIDLQVLGIGSDGHIGFNEPTSSFGSRTRIKTLTKKTLEDNARFFAGDPSRVPHHCITMGIGTIMDARRILLLAFGAGKAEAIAATVEGPVSAMVPATILQHHPQAKLFLDESAAGNLKQADYYRWVYDCKPEWQRDA